MAASAPGSGRPRGPWFFVDFAAGLRIAVEYGQERVFRDADRGPAGAMTARKLSLGRIVPVAVLVLGFVLFFAFGLHRYVSIDTLKDQRDWLADQVAQQGALAPVVFIGVYMAAVAFSLPGGALLTMTGGFLFGWIVGTLYSVVGASIGAVILFLATRTAFYDVLHAKAGRAVRKMEDGFREDALSYMLVLRLVPLFPFWLVNIVPALLGVPLRTYVIGTFLGIIPGAFVYAGLGNGVDALLEKGQDPNLGIIFEPEVILPLLGLAVLAMVPVVHKKLKGRRAVAGGSDSP